jgi:hypothetical protein
MNLQSKKADNQTLTHVIRILIELLHIMYIIHPRGTALKNQLLLHCQCALQIKLEKIFSQFDSLILIFKFYN